MAQNLFLQSLPPADRTSLLLRAKEMELPQHMILHEPDEQPQFVYLLTSGVFSNVRFAEDGQSAEVGVTGCEGVVSGLMVLGPTPAATQGMMQIGGAGYRISLAHLRSEFLGSLPIRKRLLEFIQVEAVTGTAIAGCHRLHTTEERMAHWLLMVQDREQRNDLHITQTFLAMMLGSGRPTVTLAAGALQRRGILELHRGHVVILDRAGLEEASCECYHITRKLFRSLYVETK